MLNRAVRAVGDVRENGGPGDWQDAAIGRLEVGWTSDSGVTAAAVASSAAANQPICNVLQGRSVVRVECVPRSRRLYHCWSQPGLSVGQLARVVQSSPARGAAGGAGLYWIGTAGSSAAAKPQGSNAAMPLHPPLQITSPWRVCALLGQGTGSGAPCRALPCRAGHDGSGVWSGVGMAPRRLCRRPAGTFLWQCLTDAIPPPPPQYTHHRRQGPRCIRWLRWP